MHSRPVDRRQKDVSRNKRAGNDRGNTHRRRHVVTRYEPYKRPDPTKVPPILFADRPRMLHDPNLKDEWVGRARQLLREPGSLTRAGDDQIWRHPSQHPYDDPSPAFIWRSPFARHTAEYEYPPAAAEEQQQPSSASRNGADAHPKRPHPHPPLCLQALLSVPAGEWMLLGEVIEFLFNRYPRLKGPERRSNWDFSSALNRTLKKLASDGLVEKHTLRGLGARNRWRIAEGARGRAASVAWHLPMRDLFTPGGLRDPLPGLRPRRRSC